jgi:hypothetical protein
MGTLGFMFLPVAVGIALLKYGLYDIEVLINRTLVYGVLTAILAAVYFGGIVVLQRLFVALTATLRNETDLDALRDDLVGVVRETMQPAHVQRWLRPDLPPTGSEGRE